MHPDCDICKECGGTGKGKPVISHRIGSSGKPLGLSFVPPCPTCGELKKALKERCSHQNQRKAYDGYGNYERHCKDCGEFLGS